MTQRRIAASNLETVLRYYSIPHTSTKEKIICPLHHDKNASLLIDIEKDEWFCFGCQHGGDAFAFHKEYQNKLGNNSDMKILTMYSKILKTSSKSKSKLIHISEEVKDKKYYIQKLKEAKDFYYGLKKVDWSVDDSELVEYMQWRGFTRETLDLMQAKYTYQDSYPITFPIYDNGRFKGWVSRTFDREIEKKRKYLYNTGFRRRYTLAGDYHSDTVMLVEGYMDMAKAKQLGVIDVAAVLGWKITNWQVEKLKEAGVKYVISALDNDKCGKLGTKELKKYFTVVHFPYPDDVKDMGDMTMGKFFKANKILKSRLKRVKEKQ